MAEPEEREDDLRSQIVAAMEQSSASQTPDEEPADAAPAEPAPVERPRDEQGRFASKAAAEPQEASAAAPALAPTPEASAAPAQPAAAPSAPAAASAPASWTAEAKAAFSTLPPVVQAEIAKREREVAQGFSKLDEERAFGRNVQQTILPYLPQIRAEGGEPVAVIGNLLQTAFMLRQGTPEEKGRLLMRIAQQYGATFPQAEQQGYVDPAFQELQSRLNALEQEKQQASLRAQQQAVSEAQKQYDEFFGDPQHQFAEKLKPRMAHLLQAGMAQGLKDAYEQACYLDPEVRSTLEAQRLAKMQAEAEAKRTAEIKAKAERARVAGSSVSGAPGATAPTSSVPADRSLRDELAANLAAATGRI